MDGFGLQFGIETSLSAKLSDAAGSIQQGLPLNACSALQDLSNEVAALSGKKLSNQQAAKLQLDTTWTETSLDCPK